MARSKEGIGASKGVYFSNDVSRKSTKKYKDGKDVVLFLTPLGTSERISALGVNRQQLLQELAENYIREKGVSN
ncbi:MAG: hypothetical protein K6G43_10120 [Lachnospiraceae bacterium]|nr:hypothetical protein [Lachnospiraceae bacterium]